MKELLATAVLIEASGTTDRVRINEKVVIVGCDQEDECSMDYTSRGTWVLKRLEPGEYRGD
jgi:hypothetical protein